MGAAAARHLFGPRPPGPQPAAKERESCKQSSSWSLKLWGWGIRGPSLFSARSTPGVRGRRGSLPLISSSFSAPSRVTQDFVFPRLRLPRPAVAAAPRALHTPSPGASRVLFQLPVSSLSFPGPAQASQGSQPCRSRRTCTSPVFGAVTVHPGAPGHAHAHPEVSAVAKGRRALPRPCLPPVPESRTRLPGAQPARAPGTPGLARAAPPGGWGCGPNSAASPCSSWPPSSPASWRSSAAPLPGPCWPATPGGTRGAGAAAGFRGPEAQRLRARKPRGPQTHPTHTPGGGGALPPHPLGRLPPDSGGGVACTKYRLQGLAGAKIARARQAGHPREGRGCESGPFTSGRSWGAGS